MALLFDGELKRLAEKMAPFKQVRLEHGEAAAILLSGLLAGLSAEVTVLEQSSSRTVLRVPRTEVPAVVARLASELPIADLSVEDPPIEAVIDQIYRQKVEL
jgi:ABC-2 type transport system ATP-binding protein